MGATWFFSDPHWGHNGVCQFLRNDGEKLRPWTDPELMNEEMSANWNNCVKKEDKVYVLGDWAINNRFVNYGKHLNGRKILIKGNHDIFKLDKYLEVFDDIRSYQVFPKHGIIASHIPLHPCQFEHRFKFNIHGHLHSNDVLLPNGEIDLHYFSVCVEKIDFKPILFDDILDILGKRLTQMEM